MLFQEDVLVEGFVAVLHVLLVVDGESPKFALVSDFLIKNVNKVVRVFAQGYLYEPLPHPTWPWEKLLTNELNRHQE